MIGFDSRFYRDLRTAIQTEMIDRTHALANGLASSFDDYKHRTGVLEGLRAALRIAEEVERKLSGHDQPKAQG